MAADAEFLVLGAGASGLTAAARLRELGRKVLVVEADSRVGGRLRTDEADGFRFDHGFQVLLTAYPAVQRWLDLDALGVRAFRPGAYVLLPGGRTTTIGDPLREPSAALPTLASPVGSLSDKLRLLRLVAYVRSRSPEQLFASEETSTDAYLRRRRFSEDFVERFFRPFYGGIFLERGLATSSRMFLFTFKMFAEGQAVLPAGGIQAIAEQLADRLGPGSLLLGEPVARVEGRRVDLASGRTLEAARAVLDTTSPPPGHADEHPQRDWLRTVNVYFAAHELGLPMRLITLLPGGCPVNNVAVLDGVQPTYAAGQERLVSVTVFGPRGRDLDFYAAEVRRSLRPWLGETLDAWRPLRHYEVGHALPLSRHVSWSEDPARWQVAAGHYRFGDYRLHPSLQAAMHAGTTAADHVAGLAA